MSWQLRLGATIIALGNDLSPLHFPPLKCARLNTTTISREAQRPHKIFNFKPFLGFLAGLFRLKKAKFKVLLFFLLQLRHFIKMDSEKYNPFFLVKTGSNNQK